MLPGFKSFFYKEYESKVMAVEFIPKNGRILYGYHDGQLTYLDYDKTSTEKPQPKSMVFSNECILQIKCLFETKCLIIMPTAIKIVQSIKLIFKVGYSFFMVF